MYYLMKESAPTANFSIILPGPCNAACSFCFWKRSNAESPMFVQTLVWYLQALKGKVTQISVTGGEPTISPVFDEVMNALRQFTDIKIVLTTNGANLLEKINVINGVVKHVNISRHAVNDDSNQFIFGTKSVPAKPQLADLCEVLNSCNIDVTLNKVISHDYNDHVEFDEFVRFIKEVGASALALRKDYSVNSLDSVPLEAKLGRTGTVKSCPVCSTNSYLYRGVPVHFKMSLEEPSEVLPYIYEYVYHPNSLLSEDWAGKKPIELQMRAPVVQQPKPSWGTPNFSYGGGCGQVTFRGCGQ